MSRIKRYMDRISDSIWTPVVLGGTLISLIFAQAGLHIYADIRASHPRPPIYRDVNGDGVEDKIIQRRVQRPAGLFTMPGLEDEVLYGVDIDGRKIFLPEEQFNGLEK